MECRELEKDGCSAIGKVEEAEEFFKDLATLEKLYYFIY